MILTVTFHCADNYGAVWQAFALQRYLKTMYPNETIGCLDYKPDYLLSRKFKRKGDLISSCLRFLITYKSRKKRIEGFKSFTNKYIQRIEYSSIKDLDIPGNIFIAGSDQIWNKKITNGQLDRVYLLLDIKKAKKVSYAASAGISDIESLEEIFQNVKTFNAVGVRELNLYNFFMTKAVKNLYWNVDPVFLLDASVYKRMIPTLNEHKYVLFYTLETNNSVSSIVKEVSHAFKTISIGTYRNIYGTDKHYPNATPEEFLSLILNAELIVTNSFHTIAFSIIMEKRFRYIPLKNGRGSRIESLLNILGVRGNYCDDIGSRKTRLEKLIYSSKKYIDEIIKG